MKSKEYTFLEASWPIWVTLLIISFPVFVGMGVKIMNSDSNVLPPYLLIVLGLLLIITGPILVLRIFAINRTTIYLRNNEMSVYRISLINIPIKANFKLNYSEIEEFRFREDQNWYWLKITDIRGKKYRIFNSFWTRNKQFKEFESGFSSEMELFYNSKTTKD